MKKAVSIILAFGMFFGTFRAYAAQMDVNSIIDPAEQIIMVNGNLSTGPDGIVSVQVTNSEGVIVFADELTSGIRGAFRTSFDISGFADGEYLAKFKSNDASEARCEFTVPVPADAAEPIVFDQGDSYFLINGGAPDAEYSQITLTAQNAELLEGSLSDDDFIVEGLPDGYSIEGKILAGNKVVFKLKGAGTVTNLHNVRIKLRSTVISGGTANTTSDAVAVKIYSEEYGKTVQVDKNILTGYMKNSTAVDSDNSVFEIAVLIRKLVKEGKLTDGTDYAITIPLELTGLKCDIAANTQKNTIQIRLSGNLQNALTADKEMSIKLKSGCVSGAENDSELIKIKVVKKDVVEETGGGFGGGGGGGYTGGGMAVVDITPTVPKKEISFYDTTGHWAENEILRLAENGYVSGVGGDMFVPNRSISRAEFVTMAVKAFNLNSAIYNNNFEDVLSTDWYAGYVANALSAGLISEDTHFRPNDPIKREEMTKIIVNAYLLNNEKPEWVNISQFNDKTEISDYAVEFVELAVTLGLIKGDDQNRFNPKKSATRAEAAVMFYRLLFLN